MTADIAAEPCVVPQSLSDLQEATTVGVKNVAEAKQVLKAMQNLEAAMQQAAEGSGNIQLLRGRILAAEQAGIGPHWLKAAAALEKKLLISEVALLSATSQIARPTAGDQKRHCVQPPRAPVRPSIHTCETFLIG